MPLQDHFHPPLSVRRNWHAFHNSWATFIAVDLTERLPSGYFAEANVQFGIEIDVGTFDERDEGETGGWLAPAPVQTIPLNLATDQVEVRVYRNEGGPVLAAVVELVSPANKDRPAHREAFVSKCETLIAQGVGLAIVDVVTERGGNLHNELMLRLAGTVAPVLHADLYATSYRPQKENGRPELAIWQEVLAVGQPLPTLPLWLRGGFSIPLDLEVSYERTCRELRVLADGA